MAGAFGIDPSVLDRLRTFQDYQQAEEEFQLKKQLAAQGALQNQLQNQALIQQVANGGISNRDLLNLQLQQQNQQENRALRQQQMEDTNAYRQMQLQNQQFNQQMAIQNRQDALQQKEDTYRQSVAVPGFDIAQGFRPDAKSAEEIRKLSGARNVIQNEVSKLRDLVKKSGTEFGFGEDQAAMEQSAQRVMLNLKELENLGVLNGPDVGVLAKSFMNPTDLRNQFRNNKTVLDSFDNFEKYLNDRVSGVASARGYAPQGNQQTSGIPQGAQFIGTSNGRKVYRLPDGGGWIE